MRIDERADMIDLIAQAVIDRIEERDRIAGMVNLVVKRVIEIQEEEAAAKQEALQSDQAE